MFCKALKAFLLKKKQTIRHFKGSYCRTIIWSLAFRNSNSLSLSKMNDVYLLKIHRIRYDSPKKSSAHYVKAGDLHKMSFGNHSLAFLRYSINIFVAKLHYKFDVQKSISVDVRLMNDSWKLKVTSLAKYEIENMKWKLILRHRNCKLFPYFFKE